MPYRCSFFIDGFNFFHAVDDLVPTDSDFQKLKWTDYVALGREFLPRGCDLTKVYYFTAYADWDPGKRKRHNELVRANRRDPLFEVVLGKFKQRDRTCFKCQRVMTGHEEKQTDVNIAIELLAGAVNDEYDTAMIVTGDNDITPAVRKVKLLYPAKRVGILLPPNRRAKDLTGAADYHIKMFKDKMMNCILPDPVEVAGKMFVCPPKWK